MLTALFKAYFEELANIGETAVLADVAVKAGLMSRDEVGYVFPGLWTVR